MSGSAPPASMPVSSTTAALSRGGRRRRPRPCTSSATSDSGTTTGVAADAAAGRAGGRQRQPAQRRSLTAEPNEVTGITGLLGSGVSELVSLIAGSASATSGTLRVGGAVVSLHTPADALGRGVAFVSGDCDRWP